MSMATKFITNQLKKDAEKKASVTTTARVKIKSKIRDKKIQQIEEGNQRNHEDKEEEKGNALMMKGKFKIILVCKVYQQAKKWKVSTAEYY